jgi:methylmalonyl-CoA epimerase
VPVGEATIELLEPTSPDSPIARFIDKRGPGLHHVTLRVDDLRGVLARLRERGIRLIDEQPRVGAEGALIAFVHPASTHGVLVELKQRVKD